MINRELSRGVRPILTALLAITLIGFGPATPAGSAVSDATSIERLTEQHDYNNDSHAEILRLYQAIFDRSPDLDGAKYWIRVHDGDENGSPYDVLDIARFMSDSEEWSNAYQGSSDEEFLDRVYRNVLGREYDQAGFTYWLDTLTGANESGLNPDLAQLDRPDVVFYVTAGAEFVGAFPFLGPDAELNAILERTPITFDSGTAVLASESQSVIDQLVPIIQNHSDVRFEVGSHTDSLGPTEANLGLTRSRAGAIVQALRDNGVSNQLSPFGYGETRLLFPDDKGIEPGKIAAREANNRIVFRTVPSASPVSVNEEFADFGADPIGVYFCSDFSESLVLFYGDKGTVFDLVRGYFFGGEAVAAQNQGPAISILLETPGLVADETARPESTVGYFPRTFSTDDDLPSWRGQQPLTVRNAGDIPTSCAEDHESTLAVTFNLELELYSGSSAHTAKIDWTDLEFGSISKLTE